MRYLLFFLFVLHLQNGFSQSSQDARDRSVELELVNENGLYHLEWTADPDAPEYRVYEKNIEDTDWGAPVAILPGDATRFDGVDLPVGSGKEYAVFKHEFDLLISTVEVPAGEELTLEFTDMFSIGLCCDFGFGYYRLEGCGMELAYGDDFGDSDITTFTVCDNGQSTETLTLTIRQDMFPQSTAYELRSIATDSVYLTSGVPGTLIAPNPAYGYLYAGNELPAVHHRGGIIVLAEAGVRQQIAPEMDRLQLDLIRDGWRVYFETAEMTETPVEVRNKIQALYAAHPEINSLFIVGHVPVPYSGEIAPDTHFENHEGAWAADVYYGELDGNWTDVMVSNTTAQFEYNHNVPGDGKFDQDSIPGGVELAVGRVDFFDMPAFAASEVDLLKAYFQKNHLFRNSFYDIPRRALIDDNFDNTFAAPAASAWRNFSTMFGEADIVEADYFSTMSSAGYLWSYGCGSGSHISAAGIGTTENFSNSNLNTIFTMLFGSQFGDWDNRNNFLRAPLASGLTLTNCWAGSPPWTFHQMSMGAPIGTCVRATQDSRTNGGIYLDNGPQLVHVALMGDPSLRMHPVIAPLSAFAQEQENEIKINWEPAGGTDILGYNIYRATEQFGEYNLLNDSPVAATTYTDFPPATATYHYLIRTVKLESSASGTYLNMSPGAMASSEFILGIPQVDLSAEIRVTPNPVSDRCRLEFGFETVGVAIDVFSVLGARMEVGVSEGAEYSVELDFSGIADGVYFVRIAGTDWMGIKRVVVK